jgi:hypothetical protein
MKTIPKKMLVRPAAKPWQRKNSGEKMPVL